MVNIPAKINGGIRRQEQKKPKAVISAALDFQEEYVLAELFQRKLEVGLYPQLPQILAAVWWGQIQVSRVLLVCLLSTTVWLPVSPNQGPV